MRLAVGSDHAGLALKQQLVEHCKKAGHDVEDVGTHTDASCDYPGFALAVSQRIVDGKADLGLLVCGTGIGMSMTANKVPGIRAAVLSEPFSARMARIRACSVPVTMCSPTARRRPAASAPPDAWTSSGRPRRACSTA